MNSEEGCYGTQINWNVVDLETRKNTTLTCQFDPDGILLARSVGFLQDNFTVGASVFDHCAFLFGAIETMEPGESLKFEGIHLDVNGQHYIIDSTIQRDQDSGYRMIIENESERYRAINQLSQQRNEADIMRHQLERQNQQLLILKQVAEAAAQTKTEFLAKMSHEIRTPLNALLGFASLLEQSQMDASQTEHIGKIQTAGKTLSVLLNDILDLAKIESGKYQLVETKFNLDTVVRDVVELSRGLANEKGLPLNLEIEASHPKFVIGDQIRLGQILLNLLTNAIKFTDSGYVKISVIPGESTESSDIVGFRVADSGRGIPKDQHQEIFRNFSQSQPGDGSNHNGIGLGLAIVQQLVQAMRGRIELSSEPGNGSVFSVWLPFMKTDAKAIKFDRESESSQSTAGLTGKSILVAEDSALNQQYVSEILDSHGCNVIVTENGAAAIQGLMTEPVDLILMDIHMPEMRGDEAIERIRKDLLFPLNQIPIICFSGQSGEQDRARYLSIGADDVMAKPYSPTSLTDRIIAILDKSEEKGLVKVDEKLSDDISEEMLQIFKSHVPLYLRDLLIALHTQDEKQFIFQAHKLQSSMWVMEFMDLYVILERLESESMSFGQRLELCREICQAVEQSLNPV